MTQEALVRHLKRRDWPHRDPPGWLFWGRALDAVAAQLHGRDEWRAVSTGGGRRSIAVRDFGNAASQMIDWVLADSLPFQVRDHTGRQIAGDNYGLWVGADAQEIAESGIWPRYMGGLSAVNFWIDVDASALQERLDDLAKQQDAEARKATAPDPGKKPIRQWVTSPETLSVMEQRLRDAGLEHRPGERSPTDMARVLLRMFEDAGRTGGSHYTFHSYAKEIEGKYTPETGEG